MRLLTTSAEINRELLRLITRCSSCEVAVAWASAEFKAFDRLLEHRSKIRRMIVGTHFYQTHPRFIESFLGHSNVRFVLKPDGVFHPKVYLFNTGLGRWECVVGSPNFTRSGLERNAEIAVLISDTDQSAAPALRDLTTRMDAYWNDAAVATESDLEAYRESWKRRLPVINALRGRFGDPQEDDIGDGGQDPQNVREFSLTWTKYFDQVKSEADRPPNRHSFRERIKVVADVARLFQSQASFAHMPISDRRKIAGLVQTDHVNFLWFGSMVGAGVFYHAINDNNEHLSRALDLIPRAGAISRDEYLAFIQEYRRAFPSGRDGIGTATRLLSMKRPDYFVCLNAGNTAPLCTALGIKKSVGYQDYWDSIIERIKQAPWWNSPEPPTEAEKSVWQARAAFLDSLFYNGVDMPSAQRRLI